MAFCYEVSQVIGITVGFIGSFLTGIYMGYRLFALHAEEEQ